MHANLFLYRLNSPLKTSFPPEFVEVILVPLAEFQTKIDGKILTCKPCTYISHFFEGLVLCVRVSGAAEAQEPS